MLRPSLILLSLFVVGLAKLCPNPEYSCPEDSTCCLLADDVPPGEYGCCPMPEATCCEDHIHCCPGGQQCNVEEGSCYASDGSVSKMLRKFRARKTNKPIEEDEIVQLNADVICPDGKQRCPALTTCCELETGQFGCCPAPNAVCCQDHMHCCPDGYRCDTTSERCRQKDASEIFGVRVIPSIRKFPATKNVVKPTISYRDAKSRRTGTEMQKRPVNCGNNVGCSKGHTCCEALDDESGPFPEQVCCPMADVSFTVGDGRDCERPALSENAQYLRLLKKAWFNED
ncbi:pgrn-1 [Pristionchus pacificus]|uniref:Pgrn-1 n=1 Tax=Pristionchus pacificus TaxID=54126 RepID=A0A2A6BUH1_PRIPA|nr:pgrn-1 [Pristionchus pacificus]|eukprot:PDM69466.1 pgrn-1 [Pristionchus pacificus]